MNIAKIQHTITVLVMHDLYCFARGSDLYSDHSLVNIAYYNRRLFRWMVGKDHIRRSALKRRKVRIGSSYGGWFVDRDLLTGVKEPTVFSFGLGRDITFDLGMIETFNATVHGFDPTPYSLQWLEMQDLSPRFRVYPFGLGKENGTVSFGYPKHESWDSFSAFDLSNGSVTCPVRDLASVLVMAGTTDIDVLKMDIEGSEYDVIDQLVRSDVRPSQLLVEFHYKGSDNRDFRDVERYVGKLENAGYLIFDVSPWGREFSFIHSSIL